MITPATRLRVSRASRERALSFASDLSSPVDAPEPLVDLDRPVPRGPPRDEGAPLLEESIPTLAERLRERGYDTAGFSANVMVGPTFGLQRGFRDFAMIVRRLTPPKIPFGVIRSLERS